MSAVGPGRRKFTITMNGLTVDDGEYDASDVAVVLAAHRFSDVAVNEVPSEQAIDAAIDAIVESPEHKQIIDEVLSERRARSAYQFPTVQELGGEKFADWPAW